MDDVVDLLERQLAHLRKMMAMMSTGGISMRSGGKDVTAEMLAEHQALEVDLSVALRRPLH
jgi:hypothetical protein